MTSTIAYRGIDVSKWNVGPGGKPINWQLVAQAGISFAYIKANEGVSANDPRAMEHAKGAIGAGLKVGYYHFATLNKRDVVNDANDEAEDFTTRLLELPAGALMPALDIERDDLGLGPAEFQLWIQTFVARMSKNRFPRLILYSSPWFLNSNLPKCHALGTLPLWLANYTNAPQPMMPTGWTKYVIWQHSEQGEVPGIFGKVDLNRSWELPV